MVHFLPWEERTPQKKQEEDQKDTAKSTTCGPQGSRLPMPCSDQEKDELGFAAQAEFLERREVILGDSGAGIMLLKLPCSLRKPQQCEGYRGLTSDEWWAVINGGKAVEQDVEKYQFSNIFTAFALCFYPLLPVMVLGISPQGSCGWWVPQVLSYKGENSSQGPTVQQNTLFSLRKADSQCFLFYV